jgi:hypothetical protein
MGPRLRGLLLAWTLTFLPASASALDIFIDQAANPTIVARGEIVKGDQSKLRAFLEAHPRHPAAIAFHSPGGLAVEGMSIGYFIRKQGLATRVGDAATCASACVFAFLGGVIREAAPSARLGVHMTSLMGVDAYIHALKRVLLLPNTDISLDDKIRLIVALNEQHATAIANTEAGYVLKMGVSLRLLEKASETLQMDIHWLTRAEMRDYNVTNAD